MSYKKHYIINSQFVSIEQTPAGLGYRVIATITDYLVLLFYYMIISILLQMLNSLANSNSYDVLMFLFYLLPIFYQPICEQFFHGATLGKMVAHTRVVMLNGDSVSFSASALRWLLGLIDFGFFNVGLAVMTFNKRNQRLGDLAAGTIVIREDKHNRKFDSLRQFTSLSDDYQPTYPFAADFTWGQISFINQTAMGLYRLNVTANQRKNIVTLANKIAGDHNITLKPNDCNTFLRTLVNDYNYYTWHDNV